MKTIEVKVSAFVFCAHGTWGHGVRSWDDCTPGTALHLTYSRDRNKCCMAPNWLILAIRQKGWWLYLSWQEGTQTPGRTQRAEVYKHVQGRWERRPTIRLDWLGVAWNAPPPHTCTFSSWIKPDASMLLRLSAADKLQTHDPHPAHIYQSVEGSIWNRDGRGAVKETNALPGDC